MGHWIKRSETVRELRDGEYYCEKCQLHHKTTQITAKRQLSGGFRYYLHRGPHMTTHDTFEEAKDRVPLD